MDTREILSISSTSTALHSTHAEDYPVDDAEEGKLLSIECSSDRETIFPRPLRSILRQRVQVKVTSNAWHHVQQRSLPKNDNDARGECSAMTQEKEQESKNNAEDHQLSENSSRHEQKDQFERTLPSTSFVFPLGSTEKRRRRQEQRRWRRRRHQHQQQPPGRETEELVVDESTEETHYRTDQSLRRPTCVTFADAQPTVIRRTSSVSSLTDVDSEPRSSITFVDMREELSRTTTTTTTTRGPISSMSSEYRPVYVSPLKYRPLIGLSANDTRLLLERRVSLLGKPLVFHPIQKRSHNYRRNQLRIYNFLERAHGYQAVIYHTFVFITVFVCLFLSVVVTMPEYEKTASILLLHSEIIVFIWLSIELSFRVWSAGCRSRYQTWTGRLRFIKKPFCALDLTVIIATVVTLCWNLRGGNGVFAASALRGLRFFQILRMLRMDRRGGTWKLLGSVVYDHRQELITTIYIGFLVLIFSSFIMYIVEKDTVIETSSIPMNNLSHLMHTGSIGNLVDTDRHKFETFADALWWGIITLCTVGYGDKVPSSYLGKLVAAVCSFIGISFFALPAGILGSGFALKVQQQQRQKHYKRRKIPAVLLIQNLWRVYAADEKSLSKATWKVHVRPLRKERDAAFKSHGTHQSHSFKTRNNHSFLNRVSFRRRTPARDSSTSQTNHMNTNASIKSAPNATVAAMRSCIDTLSDTASISPPASVILPHEGSSSENEDDHFYFANDVQSLTPIHRHAIRFVRKVKYFVARRKFREALRPYDVTDVIEQYSTGNVDMLARMKYLQARLDKVLGTSKSLDSYESGPSLASRICKIETQVDNLDIKVDKLCHLADTLLERQSLPVRRLSIPSPLAPVIINRLRPRKRFHVPRRRPSLRRVAETVAAHESSMTDVSQLSVPTDVPMLDQSQESLISLYCLFQENLSSSAADVV